jgi:nucleotide-binding universal stress UspA family protein
MPIVDPLQTRPAFEHARLLTANGETSVDVLHVFSPTTPQAERQRFLGALQLQLEALQGSYPEFKGTVKLEAKEDANVLDALIEAAPAYDCVLMGTTRDSWIQERVFGSKPSLVAREVRPPVILVRPETGRVGFGLRRVLNYVRGGYRTIDPTVEKELQEQGILMPKAHHDVEDLHSSVNQVTLVLCGLLAVASTTVIYLGDGGTWTWIGVVGFFIALAWFTRMSMRGAELPG